MKPQAAHVVGLAESADFGLDLSPPAHAGAAATPDLDDWQLAEDLKQLRRMLHSTSPVPLAMPAPHRTSISAPVQAGPTAFPRPGRSPRTTKKSRGIAAGIIGWFSLASAMCGVALLGMSFAQQRADLWNLGLPITFGGQFGLLCALIMQLDCIRSDSSQAAEQLGHVGERLHEIKESTALLATPNHTAGGAFYAHLAQGASPQLLLADLKGQLDLLAMRLASSR